ncbi:hypothetical protein D4R71_08465 [bacterium]|nr:MAG: hypothetical protein D4R71_08465 [bacterium]
MMIFFFSFPFKQTAYFSNNLVLWLNNISYSFVSILFFIFLHPSKIFDKHSNSRERNTEKGKWSWNDFYNFRLNLLFPINVSRDVFINEGRDILSKYIKFS